MQGRNLLTILMAGLISTVTVCAEEVVVDEETFSEIYSTKVPVSGRVLTGIAIAKSGRPDFQFLLPLTAQGERMCFRVISQDGSYVSENEYQIANVLPDSLSSANYPTQYAEEIASIPPWQLALLATPGQCKNKNPERVYLSARGDVDVPDKVTIYVSSGRSAVYLRVPNYEDGKETIKCDPITSGVRTAFDTLCHIEFDRLLKGVNELSLVRRKSGRTLPPVTFKLLVEK